MRKSKHKYEPRAKCAGCGRPYGDANGFPDLIIENWAWKEISPNRDSGGLLCPCCILENLYDLDIKCKGSFVSGGLEAIPEKDFRKLNDKCEK